MPLERVIFGCPDNACIDQMEDYGYQQMVLKTQLVFQMVSMGLKHMERPKEWHIEYFNPIGAGSNRTLFF